MMAVLWPEVGWRVGGWVLWNDDCGRWVLPQIWMN